jgi:hypothetical protein
MLQQQDLSGLVDSKHATLGSPRGLLETERLDEFVAGIAHQRVRQLLFHLELEIGGRFVVAQAVYRKAALGPFSKLIPE